MMMTLKTPTLAASRDPLLGIMRNFNTSTNGAPRAHEIPGYIVISHWNPEFEISNKISDDYMDFPDIAIPAKYADYEDQPLESCGVCDSPEAFDALFGDALRADPRVMFVSFVEIRREDQDSDGGWRYHKWGTYIGDQKPEHEYIYHDKHIDRVFTFHIYGLAS